MAVAEELQIIVDAKVSQAVRDLKKVDKTIDGSSKTTSKLTDMFKKLAGPVAIGAVVAGVVKIGKESERAFQIQEKAVIGVNAALKATGQFSEAASQDIQDYASELQELTVIGDETTLSLIQTAINMGLTADEAKEATKQAIGMSEAYGVGLETALRGTANATLGNFDALTRYLPAIKTATTDAEKAAIVNEQLAASFEVATANAKTAEGVQKQLSNTVGDLQETIGGLISNAITPWRAAMNDTVQSINKAITTQILQNKVASGQATVVEKLILANEQLEQQRTELTRRNQTLAATEASLGEVTEQQLSRQRTSADNTERRIRAQQELITSTEREIDATARQISELEIVLENERLAAQAIIDRATAQEEAAERIKTAIQEEADARTEAAARRIAEAIMVEEAILAREERISQVLEDAQRDRESSYADHIDNLITTQELFADAAELAVGSVTSGFEEIGKSIVEGNLTWKSFGRLALSVLSDILRSIGAQLAANAVILAFGPPGVRNSAGAAASLAGSVAAFTASGIASGAAGSFQDGGIVPGNSFSGDNMTANVNSGEMILNKDQQGQLFDFISNAGSGSGGQTVILRVGERDMIGFMQNALDNRLVRVPRRSIA